MKIFTKIPTNVFEEIMNKGVIYSNNMEIMDSGYERRQERYSILKENSGFSNFFFGAVSFFKDSFISDDMAEMLDNVSDENEVLLELEVPREHLYLSDYDVFTEYIFGLSDRKYGFESKTFLAMELYLEKGMTWGENLQAIFPFIDKSWIVNHK